MANEEVEFDFEEGEEVIWAQFAAAFAASGKFKPESCARYADEMLKLYRERFGEADEEDDA